MNNLKDIVFIMGEKYRKQNSIDSDIIYITKLYERKYITKEIFDFEISRLTKEKKLIDKEIEESEKVLSGK